MLRLFRILCLICCCILGAALVVATFEFAVGERVLSGITGCQMNSEILPNFTCGQGLVRSLIEWVLNLPLLFAVALALTIFGPAAPSQTFMLLLYIFDLMFVLALTYPVLVFLARKRVNTTAKVR
jgi:hypothetical protein